MTTRFKKNRKKRQHVSAGHGRIGKHRKHPGGRGKAGGMHHHCILFDKYHPGYFGKVGMRYFHKLRNKFYNPIVNIDKLWSLVPSDIKEKASKDNVPLIDVTQFGCLELAPEIEFCQSQNIKVFLSIGGPNGDYSLCSPEDAKEVANFLWQLILSGQQVPDVPGLALDGIVFDIEGDRDNLYYDVLVTELNAFRAQKQFYLTSAPKCHYPDIHLHAAINTGYFDFISIKFYNNPSCEFDGSTGKLFNSWDIWTRYVPSNAIVFMGITANPGDNGYIPPEILPFVVEHIKQAPNYGGITLWNRYWDIQTIPSYSAQILPYVSKYVLRSVTKKHKAT
ncbi:hypothetical protein L6164_016951 [Bauhinia variegata]|uniref:Uncharacterized protein n=1 Tax=Bauhinia variegata TaxID=167791 RepID=A0ACB9N644_BAUVA|nr:hypothetical protein L6164_016951 [Bauhinia variegata]